jgi:hypothetical protein
VFGNIEVYEVLAQEKDQPVMVGSNLPTVGPKYKWNDNDVAYKDFGDYVVSGNPNTTYQNRSLFTRTPVAGDFPGTLGSPLMVIDPQNAGGPNCDNGASQNSMIGAGWVSLSSKDTNNCGAYIPLSDLPNRKAYLIKFKAENVSGKPLLFWVENLNSRRIDSQSYLPKDSTETSYYFVQPPMEEYGSGYALHFDNISVGQEKTINKLGTIEVYAIDYDLLIHSATQKNNMTGRAVFTTDKIKVEKLNPSLYKVDFKNPPSAGDHLVLFQAHDPGWVAVGLDSHVLIDNWTNGWTLTGKEKNLFIVFWPQTFIYIGLIILFVTVLVFILI